MSFEKKILIDIVFSYISQGLNFLLPFFVLPYLINTLSVESFGIYGFSFAFSQFCVLFVDFGFNVTATKKIVENIPDKIFIKIYFWKIIFSKIFLFIICGVVCFFLFLFFSSFRIYLYPILVSSLMVLGSVFFPIWWFQGLNKFKTLAIITSVSKLITYPFIFFFVVDDKDYFNAIFIQSFSFIIATFFSFIYIFFKYRFYFDDMISKSIFIDFFSEIKDSWLIFLSNSSISLYANSSILILGLFSSNYSVGVFSAIERVLRVVCTAILVPLNQVCYPYIINLKSVSFIKSIIFLKQVVLFVILLSIFIIFLLNQFDYFFISIFFKGSTSNFHLLQLFIFSIFPIVLGGVLGQLGLLGLGSDRDKRNFSKVYIYCGLFSLPILFLSIYYFSLLGAIFSIFIIEFLVFSSLFFFTRKFIFYRSI